MILEIGNNDLTCSGPEVVGSEIDDFVHFLLDNLTIRVVYVCHVIPHVFSCVNSQTGSSTRALVPKKSPGKFRLIHHLSFPKGASVNDGISHENSTVCCVTIGDGIQCMKLAGRGCYLAKTDIKNAFRIILIKADHYGLLGMHW